MRPWLLLAWALCARLAGALQVAILMQGSDFIDVDKVPTMSVSQLDLGDVYLSPCRAGTFSADHGGVCRECSVCGFEEYEADECLTYQDRVCNNCTACTEREAEICPCGNITGQCYVGNRVCQPLISMSVNLAFNVYASKALTVLQQRFLEQGLATGFVVYLGDLLSQPLENIQFKGVVVLTRSTFSVSYLLIDVYRLDALYTLGHWSDDLIRDGLAVTFGQGSNTFATRRRLLLDVPFLMGGDSRVDCQPVTACGPFFEMTLTTSSTNNCTVGTCTAMPCPVGYTGDFGLCTPCPNATFKAIEGAGACTACPANFTSDVGAVSQSQCRPLVIPPTTVAPTTTSAQAARTSTRAGTSSGSPAQTTAGQPASQAVTPSPVTTGGQPPALTTAGQPPAPPPATSAGPPPATSTGPPPPPVGPPPPPVGPPPSGSGGDFIVNHNEQSIVINYQESDPWALALMGTVFTCGTALVLVLWAHLHPEGHQYSLLPQAPRRVIQRSIAIA